MAKLNESIVIRDGQWLPREFTVAFRSISPKTVELEGGEAIELYVSDSGQSIVAKPYPQSVDKEAYLVEGSGGKKNDLILRIQRPVRDRQSEQSVIFRMALQRDPSADHFTKRPAETWVEITPLKDGGDAAAQPYIFYDRNFEPDTPVPVLKWTADDWPEEATRARIRFWCKDNPTEPIEKISMHDVITSPATYRQHPTKVDGVQLSIEPIVERSRSRIQVVEKYDAQSSGIDAIRVALETTGGIKPTRVEHEFDAQNKIVTHCYDFAEDELPHQETLETFNIVITRAQDIKDGALQLPSNSGLEVPIGNKPSFFSPRATSNRP
jgi:hypothetical protein